MALLEGRGLTKFFGGRAALLSVDFSVEKGQTVGLIGPNGAGKTTMFNLISAALSPDSGIIKFKGRDITGFKPHKICRIGVARTFQNVKIFPNLPVLQNVMLGPLFGTASRRSKSDAVTMGLEALDFVGLASVKAAPAKELTLANQKRLEVARALATDPEILLLDEVMAGLNPAELGEAMDLVARIREKGITVIMIEHVMKATMNLCERIIVLHHGQKIAEGAPQEIATSKEVIRVYLGKGTHAGS